MKKWIGYIAVGIGAIVLWSMAGSIGKFAGKSAVQEYRQGKMLGVLAETQREVAKQLQQQLPMRIDEVTTLYNVASADELLIYNYRMDIKKSEIDYTDFMSKMKTQLRTNVCGQKDMAYVIKNGGKYMYVYIGSDGISIGDFKIGKKECGVN